MLDEAGMVYASDSSLGHHIISLLQIVHAVLKRAKNL